MSNILFNDDIMGTIMGFHGENSYMYTGTLSKYQSCMEKHHESKKQRYMFHHKTKTSLHHIAGSMSRIDEYARTNIMNSSIIVKILNACVRSGEIDSIKNISTWASNNELRMGGLRNHETAKRAVLSGNMCIMEWCLEKGFLFNEHAMTAAASMCAIDVIRWLVKIECPFGTRTMEEASAQGDMEILKILSQRFNNSINGSRAVSYAARNGHLHVVKYLLSYGHTVCQNTVGFAALGGHLDILKYFFDKGCEMGPSVCYMSAMRGHLNIIKWARSVGIGWDNWTIRMASKRNYMEIVEYAMKNGCPGE